MLRLTAYELRKVTETRKLNLIQHRIRTKTDKIYDNLES